MAIRYLVPDGKHLPVTGEDGKPDHHLMGAAWAALHGGYRGNKYEGPDKEKAIAALRALYKSEGMELPGEAKQGAGNGEQGTGKGEFRVQSACRVLQSADAEGRAWDVEITTVGPSKSGRLDWPREVLERDAGQFNRVPSYKDHASQHSVEDLIGHIENPRMGDAALLGTLQVLDPAVWGPKLRAIQAMPGGIAGMSLDCLVECEPPPKGDNGDSGWYTRGKQSTGDRKPLKVKRVVRAMSVDLVSPPDAGGRILRAVASRDGQVEWQDISNFKFEISDQSLAEHEPTAGAKQGGLSMKEKIRRVLQAIKRFDPARGASVESEIAAFKNSAGEADEEKQFERATQALLEVEPPVASISDRRRSETAATAGPAPAASGLTEADRATLKGAEDVAKQLRVTQAAFRLNEKLTESRLPKPLRDKLAKQFAKREFKDEELDTEIQETRQAFAAVVPQNRISPESIQIGLQTEDKLQIAMDKLWGVTHENKLEYDQRGALRITQGNPHPGNDIPSFRGIREAYYAYTGDQDVTGDPAAMRRVTQLESLAAFPLALANTLNRLLVREYAAVDYRWRDIVSQITAPMDFRTQERVRVGYFADATLITEDQPYPEITPITDEQATYNVGTYGNTLGITRRAIINDDIGLMKRNVGLLGRSMARTLARVVWNQLINNVVYGPDGVAIFIAAHGNTSVGLLDSLADGIAALDLAKIALWNQTEKDSGEILALEIKSIAIPINLHSTALMVNNTQLAINGAVFSNNPYYGYFGAPGQTPAGIVKQPLATDVNDWYVFADPNIVDTIEVGFLQGRQAPEFFLADNPLVGSMFSQDRIMYKDRFEFGTTVLDYRGMYKFVNA